jgi:hypothetical protein
MVLVPWQRLIVRLLLYLGSTDRQPLPIFKCES